MTNKKDYYEILGVSRDATDAEIKKKHLKLVKQYHPDLNKSPDAEIKLKEINEAFSVLSDPEKRKRYDQFGHQGASDNFQYASSDFNFNNFEDILGDIFGGFSGGFRAEHHDYNRPRSGSDIQLTMNVSFLYAFKAIKIQREILIPFPRGKSTQGFNAVTCNVCNGKGVTSTSNRIFNFFTQQQQRCDNCLGEGKFVKQFIDFNLPRGIVSRQKIKLKNQGCFGINGGGRGDAYLEIVIRDHHYFKLNDHDIVVTVPVSYLDALLGRKITVVTLTGKRDILLSPGTKNNTEIILKNEG